MKTKTILLLTFLGAAVTAQVVAGAPVAKKRPVVIVEQIDAYTADEEVSCEYLVTPSATTRINGGENC